MSKREKFRLGNLIPSATGGLNGSMRCTIIELGYSVAPGNRSEITDEL